ncbi:LEM domain-containing protein 1 isoform X2 [Stegastes partitus]|uniref:LEM domain-containing protein 1 isoform X2 n=1 Tax=Stegastes partitus TaxID=144197 RepID=A0A9Y4JJ22_9TELE|nr:PREDICTED: lamina-associated polypeptide 2, isoforms beta/gamma-like isoform X2 [Stegastes partitus]
MPFVEDPAHLSKSRLKADLVAHNVALPPAESKKEIYVELHLKNIDQKNAADFSSDEEDPVQDVAEQEEDPEDTEMPDPSDLTDDDLKAMLLKYGVKAGPIVGSTRALYERKLKKLLQSDGHDRLNGAEKAVLYSDSEEEAEEEESEKLEPVDQSDQALQESSQEPVTDSFSDLLPDMKTTPTGIYATCRRPIRGAAQRPIQYAYPDTPISPMTLERREVERRLVPIQIQIFVFLIVACIVYFLFVNVEDGSFVSDLLDSLSQGYSANGAF